MIDFHYSIMHANFSWLYCYYLFLLLLVLVKLPLLLRRIPSRWKNENLTWIQRLLNVGVIEFAEFWHGYTIHNPKSGNIPAKALFVAYHSRGTLDLVYFTLAMQSKFVIYHLLFQVPLFSSFFKQIGGIPSAKPHNDGEKEFIDTLIKDSQPLMVLPGGVYECAKRYEDRYRVNWKKNPGFARVLVEKIYPMDKDVCVVPFHTKNCEDQFYQHPWMYTFGGECLRDWARRMNQGEAWLAPFFVTMVGPALGFMYLPRPIKIDVYIGEPIYVKPNETSLQFGDRVQAATQELVDRVQQLPQTPHRLPYWRIGKLTMYAVIALYQNISVFLLGMALAWTVIPLGVIAHYALRFVKSISASVRQKRKTQ